METPVTQHDVTRVGTTAAVPSAAGVEAVQTLITPSTHGVQDCMEVRQCGVAADEQAAPDERADASQDEPQLMMLGNTEDAVMHRA